MALFKSARYLIDGKEIESIVREVDVATTIIRLARYSDYTRAAGPTMMLAAIPRLIAAASPANAKVVALETVRTAAGMALKKATGKGYKK